MLKQAEFFFFPFIKGYFRYFRKAYCDIICKRYIDFPQIRLGDLVK